MKKNMGILDRSLRAVVAIILAALYFTDVITGTIGVIILVFACIMLLTSLIGNCPPYGLFGWNTCKIKEQKQ